MLGGVDLLGKRVLIVDDAALMRMMIKKIIASRGYEVVGEAENGPKAVELYKKLRPNVAIIDIAMPEMDGIEVVKAIRQFDPRANIIVCSAVVTKTAVEEAFRAGAKSFIAKPFRKDRLLQAVDQAVFNKECK